jgi:hypothetical protein
MPFDPDKYLAEKQAATAQPSTEDPKRPGLFFLFDPKHWHQCKCLAFIYAFGEDKLPDRKSLLKAARKLYCDPKVTFAL